MQKPSHIHVIGVQQPQTTARSFAATTTPTPLPPKSDTALQATTTECPPNNSIAVSTNKNINSNNLLRKLASSHYQSYTTALTVTIAVGCFLLLLNILIFAGIYHQRDRGKKKDKKKELSETGSCSSSSGMCANLMQFLLLGRLNAWASFTLFERDIHINILLLYIIFLLS